MTITLFVLSCEKDKNDSNDICVCQSSLGISIPHDTQTGLPINIDTIPKTTKEAVGTAFYNSIQNDSYIGDSYPDLDSLCFEATLDVVDKNSGVSDAETEYILTWIINIKDQKYPWARFNAHNGDLLLYDNGIRY